MNTVTAFLFTNENQLKNLLCQDDDNLSMHF